MKNLLYLLISICLFAGCSKDDAVKTVPKYIKILNVSIDKFPLTDNGAGWDAFDAPDLYFMITYNGTQLYKSVVKYEFTQTSTSWTMDNINLNLDHPADKYLIVLYDKDDLSADDFIGGIEFTPYSEGNYPQYIKMACSDPKCNTEWTLNVEYVE